MRYRMTAMRRNYQLVSVFETHRRMSRAPGIEPVCKWFSMRDIAFWANMKPSTYLKRKLDELVVAGWLERQEYQYRKHIVGHRYRITDNGVLLISQLTPTQAELL